MAVCPRCGQAHLAEARFCGRCGADLAGPRPLGVAVLGVLYMVQGFPGAFAGGLIAVTAPFFPAASEPAVPAWVLVVLGLATLALGAGLGWLGLGLWRGRSWAWAWTLGLTVVGTGGSAAAVVAWAALTSSLAAVLLAAVMVPGLVAAALIVGYLTRPGVRRWFGKPA